MEVIIKPNALSKLDLHELWSYRELFYIFTWRDIKVRYKQTLLGVAWALFQPATTSIIFSIFFGKIAHIPSGNMPYPLFAYSGLVIWTFFSNALTQASNSLVENNSLLKKVYFPRVIIPFSVVVTSLLDFLISLPLLLILGIYFGFGLNLNFFLMLPLILIILFLSVSGLGMALAAINVKFRDVRYILPFFIQTGLFVTPIIYPLEVITDFRYWILLLNPLTGVVEFWRQLISGGADLGWGLLLLSTFEAFLIFAVGLIIFKRTESFFADIV